MKCSHCKACGADFSRTFERAALAELTGAMEYLSPNYCQESGDHEHEWVWVDDKKEAQ
jgi:hypothetical protein